MQFFAKLGKFTFYIEIFLLIGNVPGQLGFFQPIGKKFGTGNRTQFCIEKKPWDCSQVDLQAMGEC